MKITFLGGGNMASAMIGGLLQKGFAASDIAVVELDTGARDKLGRDFGVRCFGNPDAAAWDCDLIVLAVKPQQMKAAVAPLLPALKTQVIISIAAGLRLAALSRWLGGYRRIVRTMPNTPAVIGAGITGMIALPEVSADERAAADRVLAATGATLWIHDEKMMDAITAVSGSGPAYVFLFIEALQQGAEELGFTTDEARRLAQATVLGAAHLAADSAEPPEVLRQRVTSKAGTTEAALNVMSERGVKTGVVAGMHAAAARSAELGDLLGAD